MYQGIKAAEGFSIVKNACSQIGPVKLSIGQIAFWSKRVQDGSSQSAIFGHEPFGFFVGIKYLSAQRFKQAADGAFAASNTTGNA
jgi:hypothetical protein